MPRIPGAHRRALAGRRPAHGGGRLACVVACWGLVLFPLWTGADGSPSEPAAGGPQLVVDSGRPRVGPGIEDAVTSLHQDRHGLLWIGTRGGLMLYDGQELRVFRHEVGSPTSLAGNTIRTIYEDRAGRLWIGTNTAGLDRLDPGRWSFAHHAPRPGDPTSLSHQSINAVLEDRSGHIWVATQIGLNRCTNDLARCERILAGPDSGLPHDYTYALLEDRDGTIWVGTVGGGLAIVDPHTQGIRRWEGSPGVHEPGSRQVFHLVRDDAGGRLYAATESGVLEISKDRSSSRWLPVAPGEFRDRTMIVTSLAIQDGRRLWIGTWGDGLGSYDLASDDPEEAIHAVDAGRARRITGLVADREGTLWIGSWDHGLQRFVPRLRRFRVEAIRAREPAGAPLDVTAVRGANGGGLWIGTWGEGVFLRSPGEQFFHPLEMPAGMRTVLALLEDRRGRLWVGTMGGLVHADPARGTLRVFESRPERPDGLGYGYVTALHEDRAGRLWVGVGGTGLHRLRDDGESWDRWRHDPDDPYSLSDDYVTVLFEDRRGRLWVGTRSGGLNLHDGATGRFRRFVPDAHDPSSLPHHWVKCMLEDRAGRLWVGTDGGGLARIEERSDGAVRFRRYATEDGLVDDQVVALAEDADGTLWVGTYHGLSRFDPEREIFSNVHAADGLPGERVNAAVAVDDAAIHFGTPRGLLVVRRGTPFAPSRASPTIVTGISAPGRFLPLDRAPWELERLEVPWGTVVSIGFSVLDFADPRRHRYAYRLAGTRGDWVDLGARREVTFADLDPGHYTLTVRGRSARGVWSETAQPLELVVRPPFWMTWWFRGVLALALIGAVVGIHRMRTGALKRRNRELEAAQRAREAALDEVRASRHELQRAYDRLRRLTRRLEHAKEDERRRIARELHDEMGQALTAAKINLQLLSGPDADPRMLRRTGDAIALLDRLIGHVRTLSLDLRPPLLDELGLVPALEGYLESQGRRARVRIEITSEGPQAELPAEVEILVFRIVQEAVTNALRHAEPSRITVTLVFGPHDLRVTVDDDGRGFDVQRTLARALQGEHLGLLGIRERVDVEGGEVEITSAPGRGTRIAARIPLRLEEEQDARRAGG